MSVRVIADGAWGFAASEDFRARASRLPRLVRLKSPAPLRK